MVEVKVQHSEIDKFLQILNLDYHVVGKVETSKESKPLESLDPVNFIGERSVEVESLGV